MKKIKLFLVLLFALVLIVPTSVKANYVAADNTATDNTTKYKTLNLKEALAEEGIKEEFKNYSEKDDQITIYLFRGKGCSFCRAFLSYINSITDEYGKYFKIVSYEVWNDANNSQLMSAVSTYLKQYAEGVPYVIIGEKVFPGYTEGYNDEIKKAIVDLYNTNKNDRYDVFKAMDKDNFDYSISYAPEVDDTANNAVDDYKSNTNASVDKNGNIIAVTLISAVFMNAVYLVKSTLDTNKIIEAVNSKRK